MVWLWMRKKVLLELKKKLRSRTHKQSTSAVYVNFQIGNRSLCRRIRFLFCLNTQSNPDIRNGRNGVRGDDRRICPSVALAPVMGVSIKLAACAVLCGTTQPAFVVHILLFSLFFFLSYTPSEIVKCALSSSTVSRGVALSRFLMLAKVISLQKNPIKFATHGTRSREIDVHLDAGCLAKENPLRVL